MDKLIQRIRTMDEQRFKNLIFVMKALAILFVMVYFFYDPIFPYALEFGDWLISPHIFMYASLVLACIFYFGAYRLEYYRNLHITSKQRKLTKEQKSKQRKFIFTGLGVLIVLLVLSSTYVISQLQKANIQDDPMIKANAEYKRLKDHGCVLVNHRIKYNADLQPVIVRKNINSDDVKYLNDSVSVSLRPLDKGQGQVKVEYQCSNGESLYSPYRFRDLMK